jgi:hypothetical protein
MKRINSKRAFRIKETNKQNATACPQCNSFPRTIDCYYLVCNLTQEAVSKFAEITDEMIEKMQLR